MNDAVLARRQRAPEVKQQKLLAAARTLFARDGYDNTTTAQVAAEAGVSEGILFHHFGTKKGLLNCLAEDYARRAAEAAMPVDVQLPTEEQVVRNAFAFADDNPELAEIMRKGGAEVVELEMGHHTQIIEEVIADKLRQGMQDGVVRNGDARIMSELQFALVDAAYNAWRRSGRADLREDYILEAVRCMRSMLVPRSLMTDVNTVTTQGDDT